MRLSKKAIAALIALGYYVGKNAPFEAKLTVNNISKEKK